MNLLLNLVLYGAAALTLAMGLGLLYAYRDSRRRGLLVLAAIYVIAGAISIVLTTWWPIILGFLLAVILRKRRLDLHPQSVVAADEAAADGQ